MYQIGNYHAEDNIFNLQVKKAVKNALWGDLKNKKIWITMDETTDAKKNSTINVSVRAVKPDEVNFLSDNKWLTVTNANAIVGDIKDAIFEIQLV